METTLQRSPRPSVPTIWQGKLQLRFANREGETLLQQSFVQSPQKVQRPFYPEGRQVCHVVTLHTAGGIVGGDRLSSDIDLGCQTHALLTTATAGKIYRSNGLESQQTTRMAIAPGACLEWLPQETIVFDGARYRQHLRVDLAEDALWMGWEITRLGRSARGERFDRGLWRSRTEVWQQDRLLWLDPQRIEGGSEMMTSPHGLDHTAVVASFVAVGRPVSRELVDQVRSLQPEGAGVTRLAAGLLCRYRGDSTLEVRRWFLEVWGVLRLHLCDRPPCRPRVW